MDLSGALGKCSLKSTEQEAESKGSGGKMKERGATRREILTPLDPMEWWANEFKSRALTGLIWERGDWCPFCRYDVSQWREQLPSLEALGGTFFIVTAQVKDTFTKFWSRVWMAWTLNLPRE